MNAIKAFVITEDQLEAMDEASDNAQKHFALFCVAISIMLPLIVTYPSGDASVLRMSLYIGLMMWSVTGSLVFFLSWRRALKKRKSLLSKLKPRDEAEREAS